MHQLGPACAHRHAQATRASGYVVGGSGRVVAESPSRVAAPACRVAAPACRIAAPLRVVPRSMLRVYPCRVARLPSAPWHARAARPAPSALRPTRLRLRPQPNNLPLSRYKFCIVTHPAAPCYHNTPYCIAIQFCLLQPFQPPSIAIHSSVLQPKFNPPSFLLCNTI